MTNRGMSQHAFLVLTALALKPLHGYGIRAEVIELSAGRTRLQVGTLYGILDRMAAAGQIEVDREEVVDSRLRRYYRLSEQGRNALAEEADRQAANARVASQRLADLQAGRAPEAAAADDLAGSRTKVPARQGQAAPGNAEPSETAGPRSKPPGRRTWITPGPATAGS